MCKDEIAKEGIMLSGLHRHVYYVNDFGRFGTEQRAAHDASRMAVDDGFQYTVSLL